MSNNIGESMRRLWARDLQGLVSNIRNGTFKYKHEPKKRINWRSYNEAQLNELADVLFIIKEIVELAYERIIFRQIPYKKKGPGKPLINNRDLVKIMLLQCYFGSSDRVAGGLLRIFDLKLGIKEPFSYKTIERGYDPDRTKEILDEVFKITNEWSNFNEDIGSIDGTGDPTTIKVNYETKRMQQMNGKKKKGKEEVTIEWPSKKRDFQYAVLGVGVHTKIIGAFSSTDNHKIGELTQGYNVMDDMPKNIPRLSIVVGDTLYANRPFCDKVYRCNATLYALPKSNSTLRNNGYRDWSRMTYELILDPVGFLTVFHNRSISESVNSMLKRRLPTPIKRRLSSRKSTAEALKFNIHNIRQSCYLTYLAPELTRTPLN